jgi:hypothetical protein
MWQTLANIESYRIPGKYQELKAMKADRNEKDIKEIIEDLHRTNPINIFYKEKYGLGQNRLFNVLKCFSEFYRKTTSYVQGMSYIVGCFLCYMEEEEAFWLIYSLMEGYNLKGLYMPGFPDIMKVYYKYMYFLKRNCEKIYNHFKKIIVLPNMYACRWFLTLFFDNNTNSEISIRIFDVYLLEREKTLYRFCIGLLKVNEERILACREFEEFLLTIRELEDSTNLDKWVSAAFSISITNKQLEEIDMKYNDLNKNDEIFEFLCKCTGE